MLLVHQIISLRIAMTQKKLFLMFLKKEGTQIALMAHNKTLTPK